MTNLATSPAARPAEPPENRPCRILSLDGGGIRGLLTLGLLKHLVAGRPGLLGEVTLFAGTSTGAIIAAGLAAGKSPDELIALYTAQGAEIFEPSLWRTFVGAKYSGAGRLKALTQAFGTMQLDDLRGRVLIPAFDLDNRNPMEHARPGEPEQWKPKFFHNLPGEDSDGEQKVVDVLMASSAAPTFFPSYQGFIDGGVSANNPSMAALAQALDLRTDPPLARDLGRIRLLSLGTGNSFHFMRERVYDWGEFRWAGQLINLMLDGNGDIPHYQCRQLLDGNYRRLSPDFPEGREIPLDDVGQIPWLIGLADEVAGTPKFREIVAWLDHEWAR